MDALPERERESTMCYAVIIFYLILKFAAHRAEINSNRARLAERSYPRQLALRSIGWFNCDMFN